MTGLKLKPNEVVRLLNTINKTEVIKRQELQKHIDISGYQFNKRGQVDLVKYAGWLVTRMHQVVETRRIRAEGPTTEEAHRDRVLARRRAENISSRNIGEIPDIKSTVRRKKALRNFKYFCKTYFPNVFYLPFSKDHIIVIKKMVKVGNYGGKFAIAMPRGSGKTAMCERIALWTILKGKRKYVVIFGSTKEKAMDIIDELRSELETNKLLLEDFPEACFPFRCLGGVVHRQQGQLYKGKPTNIKVSSNSLRFAVIDKNKCNGAIIEGVGIETAQRGSRKKGKRPDLIIFDDPQTDESSRSLEQCDKRMKTILSATEGMAAPGHKIAAFMPCTVISRGDLAEQMLDRKKKPDWLGERMKTLYKFPENKELWNRYEQIRYESYEKNGDIRDATEFYRLSQDAMDKGAVVAWKERFYKGEISAIQSAMEVKYNDEEVFFSEFQNEPMDLSQDTEKLTVQMVQKKLNHIGHRRIPVDAEKLTMFVDVQNKILYWAVCAWEPNFTGYVVDYGTTPKQRTNFFSLNSADVTLASISRGKSQEAKWISGLENIVDELLFKEWIREDGQAMRISRCLIDAGDGSAKPTVESFCSRPRIPGVLIPWKGTSVTAAMRPFSEYQRKRGDRVGFNWRIPKSKNARQLPTITGDVNFWKSFIKLRWLTPAGDYGCLSLFGDNPNTHRMFSDHMVSEYAVKTEGRQRTVSQWRRYANKDNHWLDCVVGCAVAASEQGIILPGTELKKKQKKHRVSFRELQERERRDGGGKGRRPIARR